MPGSFTSFAKLNTPQLVPEKQGSLNVEDMDDLLAEFENDGSNDGFNCTKKAEILAEFESIPEANKEIQPFGYENEQN